MGLEGLKLFFKSRQVAHVEGNLQPGVEGDLNCSPEQKLP